MPSGRPYPQDHLPGAVVMAVALLSLVFLGGTAYLYSAGVFRPPLDIQVADFPNTKVLGKNYRGTVLGLSSAWENIETLLNSAKATRGRALVVYPASPLKLRPIAAESFVGFEAGMFMPQTLPAGIGRLDLSGRRMLRVRIPGRGILTGMRAFRFAQKFQSRGEYRLVDGERYEIRTQYRGAPCVEHWLPITNPETATTGAEETRGRGNLKSHWPLER